LQSEKGRLLTISLLIRDLSLNGNWVNAAKGGAGDVLGKSVSAHGRTISISANSGGMESSGV
jgi:hypothetical protein